RLPDLADHFAADLGGARVPVAHDALRRRQDRHAEARADPFDLVRGDVDAPPRLRDPPHAFDHQPAVVLVAEVHREDGPFVVALHANLADEALGGEHARHGELQLGRRAADLRMARRARVADPRQHVTQRVGHHDLFSKNPVDDRVGTGRSPIEARTYSRNGTPMWLNSDLASASVRAVVTIVTFMPFTFSTAS